MIEIKILKKIMEERGFSQEKVAGKIGVSSATIFRWLHGKHKPHELGLSQIRRFNKKYTCTL